jgi:hypothetical protein
MRKIYRLILVGLLATTAGCAGQATRMEMDYAHSYRLAIANQTLHPEAALNQRPVTGMQAQEASAIYEAYVRSFERPAGSTQTFMIPLAAQGGTFSNATH